MPRPLTPSRRRARRGLVLVRTALASAVLAVLAVSGACSTQGAGDAEGARGAASAVPSPASTASAGAVTGSSAAGDDITTDAVRAAAVAEVTELLRRRAAALVAADEHGYAASVADPASALGRRQLAAYAAARALRVSRLEVGRPDVDFTVSAGALPARSSASGTPGEHPDTGTASPHRARAQVEVRYRIDDLDGADRVARLDYTLARSRSGWAVVSERPAGAGATAPWVAMPGLRVERGAHAVVAGSVAAASLAEHVVVVDREVPVLRRQWPGTPGRVLVLAPATPEEADALLGRSVGAAVGDVAASTEGPTGSDRTATGDRVVLDPTAYARLTTAGRDVVLTHELAHVAVRATVPGRAATWLAEGYADHVGYARAGIPSERLLAPLLAEVRAGRGPLDLPSSNDLQPANGDIEVPYLTAWQAVELVAAEHGEDALRRLVVAGSSTGSDSDAEVATDRALVSVLGTSRAALTHAWRQRLAGLAR